MKWKKRAVGALFTGALAVTMLATNALAGDGIPEPPVIEQAKKSADYELVFSTEHYRVHDDVWEDVFSEYNYTFDDSGKIAKIYAKQHYSLQGRTATWTETNIYDNDGRLSQKNGWGYTTIYEYNQNGQLIRETESSDSDHDPDHICQTSYTYDDNGNMVYMSDGGDPEYRYTYNEQGYPIYADALDENGNIYWRHHYYYDQNNKPVSCTVQYGNEYYDDNGNYMIGEFDENAEEYLIWTREYDSNGNMIKEIWDSYSETVYEYEKISVLQQQEPVTPSSSISVSKIFKDITPNAWYTDAVQYVYDKHIMRGMGDGTFAPGTSMTRAMVAQILYAQAGSPEVSGDIPFTDVPAGKWYSDAILWANQNDVVAGMGDGTFAPSANITRQEYAAILYRCEKSPAVSGSLDFPDADTVSGWATDAVLWATQNGIINGTANNGVTLLDPKGTATRAQSAVILKGYLEK
ncbi:MAG: S-layer homology domain-containing protein [Eubacteriales bacterium]|nr:S-layer homology domain-containing protein [Eubacteriales bacterium]